MSNVTRKLILEDGTTFVGEAFGGSSDKAGEVIFYSGMTGYQEMLTDPSYCQHIVVMTNPTIGTYGINREDSQSFTPTISGMIVREVVHEPSNFRSVESIDEYLKKYDIPSISGIDTRMLTTYLRKNGSMKGYIVDGAIDSLEEAKQVVQKEELLVEKIAKMKPYIIPGNGKRIVVIDLGVKQSLLRELMERNFHITVVPYHYDATRILHFQPDGILVSNGPGNPQHVPETIATVKSLLGKLPIFAVGLGHLIFALASGAKTKKLKTGQFGNHFPVKDVMNDRTWFVTKSSHNTVDEASLNNLDLSVTYRALNDGAIEGLLHEKYPAFSVQFHPEGAPGSSETSFLFDQFQRMIVHNELNGGLHEDA